MENDERSTVAVKRLRTKIAGLWRRKSWYAPIPDQPLVHLVRTDEPDELTDQLAGHLSDGVPAVALAADQLVPDNELDRSVLLREQLLDKIASELGRHDSRQWQGRIRFRRYALASFLLQHNETPPEPDEVPNRQARDLLRDRLLGRKRRPAENDGQPAGAGARVDATLNRTEPFGLPWYLLLPAMLLSVIAPAAVQHGVPFGRSVRWFMRQPYLAPDSSPDFASFAQRLISMPSVHENAGEVRKLLTHALLKDLTDAYARRFRWRWVRRENYPVLLLHGVGPGTTGELLINLINDVRNETGPDPLLVVASGPEELPHDGTAAEPKDVQDWQTQLLAARRQLSPTAWYWLIRVENPSTTADSARAFPRGQAPVNTTRARILRAAPTLLVLLLVAGAGVWYYLELDKHCGKIFPNAHPDLFISDANGAVKGGEQCVGFSDTHYFAADPDSPLAATQRDISKNNARAEQFADDTGATIPTLFYVGPLDPGPGDGGGPALQGVAEELNGIERAQRKLIGENFHVKVLVANGGTDMQAGAEVATRIAEHAQRQNETGLRDLLPWEQPDSPVLGVIGMGGSQQTSKKMIRTLSGQSVPMIGTTSSLDVLPTLSPLFYQVSPQNLREAEVVKRYLQEGSGRETNDLTIVTEPLPPNTEDPDSYSGNLAHDLEEAVEPTGIKTTRIGLPDFKAPCDPNQTIFFAGRAATLPELLSTFETSCRDSDSDYPYLITSDDTSKFSLDQQLAEDYKIPVDYVSFTDLEPGRSALAYDAMYLVKQAVDNTESKQSGGDGVPLNGERVWAGLNTITPERPYTGESGNLAFGSGDRAPHQKAVWILRYIERQQHPRYVCGDVPGNLSYPADCHAFQDGP